MWLLFYETGVKVDQAWEKVANATVNDELGTHAKVNPFEDRGEGKVLYDHQHAISVYTKDFTKKKHVLDIENKLRSLDLKGRMVYKPRVYSNIGVFSENKWKLMPGIYTSHWDTVNKKSKVRENEK